MTMSPDEFHRRYAAAVADEPAHAPVEQDIAVARGRHLLRRRRIVAAVGTSLAVAAIVIGSVLVVDNGARPDTDDLPNPAESPTSSVPETGPWTSVEELLNRCRAGELQDPAKARTFFKSGTPLVKVVASTRFDTSAALESADSRFWAWCRVTSGHPEWSGMDVYRSTGDRGRDFFYYSGGGCSPVMLGSEDVPGCRTFRMRWAERVSPEVASMVFVMGNGETVTLEGTDGYFVNEFVGALPDDVKTQPSGDLPGSFRIFLSLTYLNADGVAIAAQGPDGRVGNLPTLARYPFLGSQV